MKTHPGIALLILVLAGCGSSASSPTPEVSPTSRALQPPPVSALIGYRTSLELTSEQVTAIDSIGEATRRRNSVLFAKLREPRERRGAPVDTTGPDAPQTILRQIRASNREAGEAVGQVLNETQRTRACELFGRTRTDRMERMREPDGRPPRRARGELADSLFAPSQTWPWCQSTPGAPADTVRRGRG